jgi:transposase
MNGIGNKRALYTLEFKQEAVRLVQSGRSCVGAAKELGIASQTLDSWVKLSRNGKLGAVGSKPISTEQMELSRLRAENARLKMERDILKKATAYFAREHV